MSELKTLTRDDLLEVIRGDVAPRHFQTWFDRLKLVDRDDDTITLGVPNLFHQEWLEKHYMDVIHKALAAVGCQGMDVRFVVDGELFQARRQEQQQQTRDLPTRLESIDPEKPARQSSLNPAMSLDSFVVGPCNRVAYEAARQVCDTPGSIYNPLFIHGGYGLGKTHLLQGVCGRFLAMRRRCRAIYLPAESFANQFVAALRAGNLDEFRHRFRSADLLVIDDVHVLASKNHTQMELLHTFDALGHSGQQIVMASDSSPREIRDFKHALQTRFLSGLVVEMKSPTRPVRVQILKRKLGDHGRRYDEATLQYVVERTTSNIRELEGVANTLKALAGVSNEPLTLNLVRQTLTALDGRIPAGPPCAERIVDVVADYFDIGAGELTGNSRARRVTHPRQVAMYLMRELTDASYKEIARAVGSKNHTTAMTACKKIAALLEEDLLAAKDLQAIRSRLDRNGME